MRESVRGAMKKKLRTLICLILIWLLAVPAWGEVVPAVTAEAAVVMDMDLSLIHI